MRSATKAVSNNILIKRRGAREDVHLSSEKLARNPGVSQGRTQLGSEAGA
jgi:hypothetical protein